MNDRKEGWPRAAEEREHFAEPRYARRAAQRGARRAWPTENVFYQKKTIPLPQSISRAQLLEAGATVDAIDESVRRLIEYNNECFEARRRPLLIWKAEPFDGLDFEGESRAETYSGQPDAEESQELDLLLEHFADDARGAQAFTAAEHSDGEHDVTSEYFTDLHRNIKLMLDESLDQNEESFFLAEEPAPPLRVQSEEYRRCVEAAPPEVAEKEARFQQLTPAALAQRKARFHASYGYLDALLNQLVCDLLGSAQSAQLAALSEHGFDQSSVEAYCRNGHKIFSLYLQGNIVLRVWRYKKADGAERGPFTAYDMDVWNGSEGFFDDDTLVSLANRGFLPLKMFIERCPLVEWMVIAFLETQKAVSGPPARRARFARRGEPGKRVNFRKPPRVQRPQEVFYERRAVVSENGGINVFPEMEKQESSARFPPISDGTVPPRLHLPASSAWADE